MFEKREGEEQLACDPGSLPPEAGVVFIGTVRSPWIDRSDCPKNMRIARERGGRASIGIDQPYRRGLLAIERHTHLILLTWLHHAPRNLIVQMPRRATEPKGVFALRSPARPNPIGLHVVRMLSVDIAAGVVSIDALDVLDGTPVIDLKPYFASTDAFPDSAATRPAEQPSAG